VLDPADEIGGEADVELLSGGRHAVSLGK